MSIKAIYSKQKTNAYYPIPWHWSTEKFNAFRGSGHRHNGFLAVHRNFSPHFIGDTPSADGVRCPEVAFDATPSKIIKTREKGTTMLVPCSAEQDEKIMLLTLRSGFRAGYSRIEAIGCDILYRNESGTKVMDVVHMVVRLNHPNGYVYAETGRRVSRGLVEMFSWYGYQSMPTDEFEAWQEQVSVGNESDQKVTHLNNMHEQNRLDSIKHDTYIHANNRDEFFKELEEVNKSKDVRKSEVFKRFEAAAEKLNNANVGQTMTLEDDHFTFNYRKMKYSEEIIGIIEHNVNSILKNAGL